MNKLLILIAFCCFACQPKKSSTNQVDKHTMSHHSESLSKVFDAHGGYEHWDEMKSLSYLKGQEKTITNLKSRKILLTSPDKKIGFDGNDVWVYPDSIDASRARFYHNLYFYFYAMPFVVGDPGAFYEDLPSKQILDKTYAGIKISYNAGVGDASDDNYIIWYDPETYKMEWLMYTVTYKSGEANEDYRLIKYDEWNEFSELLLPTSLQWYQYQNDTVGEQSGNPVIFEEVKLTKEYPADSLFDKPEGSQIAPVNKM